MSHDMEHDTGGGGGIMANKTLWLCIGLGIFILIAFVLPTPQSVVDTIEKHGFAEKLIEWGVAHDAQEAAQKTMTVLGIIPMAIIFFATEAIPIGLTGILMPLLAYFLHLLPRGMIGKTFAGDAPMFLLGVLAMGVAVVDVGLHKRLAAWLLGWTKGFLVPHLRPLHQHVGGGLLYLGPCHVRVHDPRNGGGLLRVRRRKQQGGPGGARPGPWPSFSSSPSATP